MTEFPFFSFSILNFLFRFFISSNFPLLCVSDTRDRVSFFFHRALASVFKKNYFFIFLCGHEKGRWLYVFGFFSFFISTYFRSLYCLFLSPFVDVCAHCMGLIV